MHALASTEPPVVSGLGAGRPYPAYGAVMLRAGDWFGGHGVDIRSNGFAGNSNGVWQCVELVERFVKVEGFGPAIYGNANQLYANADPRFYDRHSNGSGYVPVPGDIITLGGGPYGHVVVVDSVSSTTVDVVEQNANGDGKSFLSLHGSVLGGEYGMSVIGVLHARANTKSTGGGGPSFKDVYAVNLFGDSHNTFVHTLLAANGYTKMLTQPTPLPVTAEHDWTFLPGAPNANGVRDIVAVHMDEANGTTGVHILDGSAAFSRWKGEYFTALPAVSPDEWAFTLGHVNANGLPDVVAINMADGTHTGIHVLDGSAGYHRFKLETYSVLPPLSPDQWKFVSGADNANGLADIVAVNLADAGRTGVHVLDGSRTYSAMKLESYTSLPSVSPVEWAFASQYTSTVGGLVDVYAIHLDETAASTGVHVITAASRYTATGAEVYSALPRSTNQQFQFGSDPYNSLSH